MNDDTNNGDAPALQEWSHWKRRAFVALLCVLELGLIAALVYGASVLWNMIEF